jgi:hypothetical protein
MAHGRVWDELARAIEQMRARAVELSEPSIDQPF